MRQKLKYHVSRTRLKDGLISLSSAFDPIALACSARIGHSTTAGQKDVKASGTEVNEGAWYPKVLLLHKEVSLLTVSQSHLSLTEKQQLVKEEMDNMEN